MCVHVCAHACACVCTCTCVHMCIVHVCICACTCVHAHACVCMHVHVYACIHMCVRACVCVHACVCACVCALVCLYVEEEAGKPHPRLRCEFPSDTGQRLALCPWGVLMASPPPGLLGHRLPPSTSLPLHSHRIGRRVSSQLGRSKFISGNDLPWLSIWSLLHNL